VEQRRPDAAAVARVGLAVGGAAFGADAFPAQAGVSARSGVNHLGYPSGTVVEANKEFMPAGQGVGAIHELIPAGDIVR